MRTVWIFYLKTLNRPNYYLPYSSVWWPRTAIVKKKQKQKQKKVLCVLEKFCIIRYKKNY